MLKEWWLRIEVARDIGAALRGRRHDLGLSQGDVAERAGVSRRWLSAFEAGKGSVELGMVLQVLATLDLNLHIEPADGGAHARPSPTSSSPENVDLDAFLTDLDEAGP